MSNDSIVDDDTNHPTPSEASHRAGKVDLSGHPPEEKNQRSTLDSFPRYSPQLGMRVVLHRASAW
jgi:hypothetical protein